MDDSKVSLGADELVMDRVLYLKAIRALPQEWVSDETRVTIFDLDTVVAANPNLPPIKYSLSSGWSKIEFKETP